MSEKRIEGPRGADPITELREILDEAQRTIDASQAILDRCTVAPEDDEAPATDLLGEIADSLIQAYRLAREEGDPGTVTVLEQAMLHVGRRLARGMTPTQAGLVRH